MIPWRHLTWVCHEAKNRPLDIQDALWSEAKLGHYITLRYVTLHYITLHYITLHYITLHYMSWKIMILIKGLLCVPPTHGFCYLACLLLVQVHRHASSHHVDAARAARAEAATAIFDLAGSDAAFAINTC